MSIAASPGGGPAVQTDRGVMEQLAMLRSWLWDLHQIGRPISPAAAREAERLVLLADKAGMPPGAGLALARDVLRRDRPSERLVSAP